MQRTAKAAADFQRSIKNINKKVKFMLNVKLNEPRGIAILEPDGKLSEEDFKSVAGIIDPYLEKSGELNGIIIRAKTFPGWNSFSALITHLNS